MPAPRAGSTCRSVVIERLVKHLGRLVDDLLDVSRIMHGKIQLKRQLTELSSVVSRAIEAIGRSSRSAATRW